MPDWQVLPLDDQTAFYWKLVDEKCCWAESREALEGGNQIYEGVLYGRQDPPVWRGSTLVLVAIDTQCDGNKFLTIFLADHEVT